ncbi:MAG TPA: hypothetical protein VKV17_14560 [Bryobacteraceae bacterium]|nr:hypothetical protein [Bryobacteraceae bacterium]
MAISRRRPITRISRKYAAALLLTTGLAWSGPASDSVTVTGYSNYVGAYTLSGNGQPTMTGYGGAFEGAIVAGMPSQTYSRMLFCDDFSNYVGIPSDTVQVDITSLEAGADFLNQTRFGAVTNWRAVESSLPPGESLSPDVANTIDSANSLERYEMAAYLASNFSFFDSGAPNWDTYYSDTNDIGIQSAIWDILNPASDLYLPPASARQDGNVTTWLTNAANWLPTAGTPANQAFLSRFQIVSDVAIAQASGDAKTQVGIQEFLIAQPVPEPGFYGLLSVSLGALLWAVRRGSRLR